MLFSNHYSITRTDADDWLDVTMQKDTRLFVDPFRIFDDDDPHWHGAHQELTDFFNYVLGLIADGHDRKWASVQWKLALRLLHSPEPYEMCLGVCADGVRGAGAGEVLGRSMVETASIAIEAGVTELKHFEELALLGPGFGVDRISDIACNVLKHRFITYTRAIVERHNIDTDPHLVQHVRLERASSTRWVEEKHDLPTNPDDPFGGAVLLVPERFLRTIPAVNAGDFFSWANANLNEQLRDELNFDISKNAKTADLVARFLRKRPAALDQFIAYVEDEVPDAYDVLADPDLLLVEQRASSIAGRLAVEPPTSADDMVRFVTDLVADFKRIVETTDAWKLLWTQTRFRRESACQQLFHAVARLRCEMFDVDISPESDAGAGPVDFKFSRGHHAKVVVELKLASSSSLIRNALYQPPAYAHAEQTATAFMVCFQNRDPLLKAAFIERTERAVAAAGVDEQIDYRLVWVDARKRESASKRGPRPKAEAAQQTNDGDPPAPTG